MDETNSPGSLAGHLLIAHPKLDDPNFIRSVVLVTVHSGDGAIGVILNRPLKSTLREFSEDFEGSDLADIPLFEGGPVARETMVVTAWQWRGDEGIFRLHFGITEDDARDLKVENEDLELRGFLGHAGWGEGQLESEMKESAWFAFPLTMELFREIDRPDTLWQRVLGKALPQLRLDLDTPEDPSIN